MTRSQFAEDAAIYVKTRDTFEHAIKLFVESASNWGLSVSSEKTKGMAVGRHVAYGDMSSLPQERGSIETDEFPYPGSNIISDGEAGSAMSNC